MCKNTENISSLFHILDLPAQLSEGFSKVTNFVQEAKNTIESLETALAKGKIIYRQKQDLLLSKDYLPEEEIQMFQQKSDQKIEDANALWKLIEDLENDPAYITVQRINDFTKTLNNF